MSTWTAQTPALAEELAARDAEPCRCGHRNVSHASYDAQTGAPVGTGNGSCGFCPCRRFAA